MITIGNEQKILKWER